MDNSPLISIIIPAYNCEEFIEIAVKSILNQTHLQIEVLIADDCSSDNTKTIIDHFDDPRIKIHHNTTNLGYLKTCNKLFALAQGEYLTFQDADDWSDISRLEKQLQQFQSNPSLGICGTWAHYYTADGKNKVREKYKAVSNEEINTAILKENQFCGASIMITRAVYLKVGGYHPIFDRIGNEDYYWAAQIVYHFEAANIAEPLYFVRTTSESISRSIKNHKQLLSIELCRTMIADYFQNKGMLKETHYYTSLIEQLEQPYLQDASLKYRKEADIRAYSQDIKGALQSAWKAINCNPYRLINYKYFVSLLFRSI